MRVSSVYTRLPMPGEHASKQAHAQSRDVGIKLGTVTLATIVILYSVYSLIRCVLAATELPYRPLSWELLLNHGYVACGIIANAATFSLSVSLLLGAFIQETYSAKSWILLMVCAHVTTSLLMFLFGSFRNMVLQEDTVLMMYVIEFLLFGLRVSVVILLFKYYREVQEDEEQGKLLARTRNQGRSS